PLHAGAAGTLRGEAQFPPPEPARRLVRQPDVGPLEADVVVGLFQNLDRAEGKRVALGQDCRRPGRQGTRLGLDLCAATEPTLAPLAGVVRLAGRQGFTGAAPSG